MPYKDPERQKLFMREYQREQRELFKRLKLAHKLFLEKEAKQK